MQRILGRRTAGNLRPHSGPLLGSEQLSDSLVKRRCPEQPVKPDHFLRRIRRPEPESALLNLVHVQPQHVPFFTPPLHGRIQSNERPGVRKKPGRRVPRHAAQVVAHLA